MHSSIPIQHLTKVGHKKVGDEIISLSYFGPAHTDGDSITHFENSNIAHMGGSDF